MLIDLGQGQHRLGGSCLAQAYNQIGSEVPDIDAYLLRSFYEAMQHLIADDLVLAYHDRSDGGLLATVTEMALAGRCGVQLDLTSLGSDLLAALFCEEVGAVIQYRTQDEQAIYQVLADHGLAPCTYDLGPVVPRQHLGIYTQGQQVYAASLAKLHTAWTDLTYRMQTHRDNPECALEQHQALTDSLDPGRPFQVSYTMRPSPWGTSRPRVAILREQGTNGHREMAAAFDAAGCEAVDVTMTDLLESRADLSTFLGLAVCGGFSYGDVLGAGIGWARSILFQARLREQFAAFFARPDTFSLGVCNGCQMLSHLKELIPGTTHWPQFGPNRSEQFEARLATVEVLESRSVLLAGMAGSLLPIPIAHYEGCIQWDHEQAMGYVEQHQQACLRYVDNYGKPTQRYPFNPNGSPGGLTALTSTDGRATVMMPHPERGFRTVQLSWYPTEWTGEDGPWLRLFQNAYYFATHN